jgi:hypothetical protein
LIGETEYLTGAEPPLSLRHLQSPPDEMTRSLTVCCANFGWRSPDFAGDLRVQRCALPIHSNIATHRFRLCRAAAYYKGIARHSVRMCYTSNALQSSEPDIVPNFRAATHFHNFNLLAGTI